MSKCFKILVDMDDTIADLLGAWVNKLNKRHGTSVSPEEITEWDICKFFPSLTREQVFSPLLSKSFWNDVKPKKDAALYLKMLKLNGHKVFICTSTNYKILKEKMDRVLFRYFDFLTWNDVIIASNKQLINADILIDDGVHNLIGGSYQGILFDMPHNRDLNENEYGIKRAKTWKEVYDIIESLCRKDSD